MSQVWLIGRPVAHSLSPAMHNAAFAALGLPHRYEAREVADEDLAATLQRMRGEDMLGANVTTPHKEAVLRQVDQITDEARRIGGVNTIVHRSGRLVGENTDGYGFRRALEAAGATPHRVFVLGAGGGGGARVVVLFRACADGHVVNHTPHWAAPVHASVT